MNARQAQAIASRAACLLAALAVTTLIVGSQLGIADGYIQQAESVVAAKSLPRPVAQQAAPAPQPHS